MYAARSWGYRHPYVCTGVRITAGTWNLVLGTLLLSRGYRWGLVLLAVSALIFGAVYILAPGKVRIPAQRLELACSGSFSVPSYVPGSARTQRPSRVTPNAGPGSRCI